MLSASGASTAREPLRLPPAGSPHRAARTWDCATASPREGFEKPHFAPSWDWFVLNLPPVQKSSGSTAVGSTSAPARLIAHSAPPQRHAENSNLAVSTSEDDADASPMPPRDPRGARLPTVRGPTTYHAGFWSPAALNNLTRRQAPATSTWRSARSRSADTYTTLDQISPGKRMRPAAKPLQDEASEAFRYTPPPDPSIATISRDTFTKMCSRIDSFHNATASRRREFDMKVREKSRKRAAAWRHAKEMQAKMELELRKAQDDAATAAQKQETDAREGRQERRNERLKGILDRMRSDLGDDQSKEADERNIFTSDHPVSPKVHNPQKWSGMSPDQRINLLRMSKKLDQRHKRLAHKAEEWRQRFENQPLELQNMVEETFNRWSVDRSGRLTQEEMKGCLYELGIRGLDREERLAIDRMGSALIAANQRRDEMRLAIKSTLRSALALDPSSFTDHMTAEIVTEVRGGVDLYEMNSFLIPSAWKQLNRMRGQRLLESIEVAESSENGTAGLDHILMVVNQIWSLGDDIAMTGDPVRAELMVDLSRVGQQYIDSLTTFNHFLQVIGRAAQAVQWHDFVTQRHIVSDHNLDPAATVEILSELVHLDSLFRQADVDGSGELDYQESESLLKMLGLIPKSSQKNSQMLRLLAEALEDRTGIDFGGFLELIKKTRKITKACMAGDLREAVQVLALDCTNGLPKGSMPKVLQQVGIIPTTHSERAAVNRVCKESEDDGDEFLELNQVTNVLCRAQEELRRMKLQTELEIAHELGFTEQDLNSARSAFEDLDADESGSLSLGEIRRALLVMEGHPQSDQRIAAAFKELDVDGSGGLQLPEFLRLLRRLEELEKEADNGATAGDDEGSTPTGSVSAPSSPSHGLLSPSGPASFSRKTSSTDGQSSSSPMAFSRQGSMRQSGRLSASMFLSGQLGEQPPEITDSSTSPKALIPRKPASTRGGNWRRSRTSPSNADSSRNSPRAPEVPEVHYMPAAP